MAFKEPTPVQAQAIPLILEGKDIIACAQTGTGKTAAFLLPVLNALAHGTDSLISALVIVPTRELAVQIDQQLQGFAYFTPVSSIPIYGGGDGGDWERQKKALTKGCDFIIATPGKLISHLNMGYVKFDDLKFLILDEADRMLDMGFYEDIMKIISHLPESRQNLLFSATMPPKIREMAREILTDPAQIDIAISKPAAGVLQAAYLAYENQKYELVKELLLGKKSYKSILIFGSTKKKVFEITKTLKREKFNVESISSDLNQSEREEVLIRFRSKKTRVLVATDVLSRGIDIKDINLVINFDVPNDAEDYVHRIGRTARADTTGVALTFINEDDQQKFARIEELIEKEIQKIPLPDHIGDGPEWAPRKQRRGGGNRRGGPRGQRGPRKKGSTLVLLFLLQVNPIKEV